MARWIGKGIVAIGALHTVFGLVAFQSVLGQLLREGLLNTVNGQPLREFAFWFLLFGLVLVVLGALVDWIEAQGRALPAFLGWGLLALTLVIVGVMPASGGWLMFAPAVGAIRRTGGVPRVARA